MGCVCFSPTDSVDTLGVLTVVLSYSPVSNRGVAPGRPANSLLFTVHSCLSKSSKCISTAQARKIWVAAVGACRDCALVVMPCTFSDMVVEISCFGGPKSTFRDRCKGSGRLYLEVQISWQAQVR